MPVGRLIRAITKSKRVKSATTKVKAAAKKAPRALTNIAVDETKFGIKLNKKVAVGQVAAQGEGISKKRYKKVGDRVKDAAYWMTSPGRRAKQWRIK
jgi:hypothetical protein